MLRRTQVKFNQGDHRADNEYFQEPNVSRTNSFLAEIKPIAEKHNATLAQLVINWTIQQPGITAALVGARNAEQVEQNAASLSFMLSQEEIDQINSELEKVEIVI